MEEKKKSQWSNSVERVGKKALWTPNDGAISFEVMVMAVRQAYGKTRYTIAPVAGKGTMRVINGITEINE